MSWAIPYDYVNCIPEGCIPMRDWVEFTASPTNPAMHGDWCNYRHPWPNQAGWPIASSGFTKSPDRFWRNPENGPLKPENIICTTQN